MGRVGVCVSLFILEEGVAGKEGTKRRGTDLCWPVRNYLTTPSLTLDALCLSLSPSSSSLSSHSSLLIFTTLLCVLPSFLLFLSHLTPLLLLGQRYLARLIVM